MSFYKQLSGYLSLKVFLLGSGFHQGIPLIANCSMWFYWCFVLHFQASFQLVTHKFLKVLCVQINFHQTPAFDWAVEKMRDMWRFQSEIIQLSLCRKLKIWSTALTPVLLPSGGWGGVHRMGLGQWWSVVEGKEIIKLLLWARALEFRQTCRLSIRPLSRNKGWLRNGGEKTL